MRTLFVVALLAACGPSPSPQTPTAPAAARVLRYSVVTVGRHAGEAETRIDPGPGGARHGHFTFNDRGRGPDVTTTLVVDDRGAPRSYRASGHDYLKAPVDETLVEKDGTLTWTSTSEHGSAAAGAGLFVPTSGPFDADALLVRALLRAPEHRIALLPAGEARLEDERRVDVKGQHLRRVAIAGVTYEPMLVWIDEDGELFAEVSTWTSVIRDGSEALIPDMIAGDQKWRAARAATLAQQLATTPPAAGLAITHARVFDSLNKKIVPDRTVIVVGDRIAAVGDASTKIPPGAQVIDAHGRTLIPGLWDMHVHVTDGDGVMDLAMGVTTVRDLGNDLDELNARIVRFDAGTELGPHVIRAGFVDGPGKFTAPTGTVIENEEQARAAVARFAELGFPQVKIYSSVAPALVPVIAAAAHAKGMRVSGHIPFGMNAAQAVEAGYDEIQHMNFLFLQFLAGPDDDTRGPLRFVRVAERAADLDLGSKEVGAFLDLLVAHHTVIDPTLSVFEAMFTTDPGELDPVIAPYVGRLPAQIERGARNGGLPTKDRARFRASYAQALRLVKLAWDRGITVVAGTDAGAGITVSHELELYVQAGIPAADALAIATIGAARVMRLDKESGSITAGKRADLVLIDGDPLATIGAVRNADLVICRGRLYDPAALFASVGMKPRR